MAIRSLLSILADGRFHSGRELGESLGVSRSAIWKQIRKLEDFGLEIYSVKGRGYRVPGGLDLLDLAQVQSALSPSVLSQLKHFELDLSIPSTNLRAVQQSRESTCHGHLYVAEQQTDGRGRRGRPWVSPFGRNLYFSLVWRFENGASALEGLSLLVGLCLVKAIHRLGGGGVQLKWPNDLLWQDRKLAGILLEMTGDASGECQVVIGAGLNVAMPVDYAVDIDQSWVDLKSIIGSDVSRNALLAEILAELVPSLNQFAVEGFAPLLDQWHAHHAHQDQRVALSSGREVCEGICRGVDARGALQLEMADGLQSFYGGELSLRRGYDTGS
ncbi:MAG: bifunctional biotin--[acetyl-CoA-carboxylase] ligase/biotin operon repressor BirA [Pontibacterium sp.]